jgi:phage-related tail protein
MATKDKTMEKKDKKDNLDQLFDNFNKKTIEQFKDILSKIDNINLKLKEALES